MAAASPLENAKASTARTRIEGDAPEGELRPSLESGTLGGRWGEDFGIQMDNRSDGALVLGEYARVPRWQRWRAGDGAAALTSR